MKNKTIYLVAALGLCGAAVVVNAQSPAPTIFTGPWPLQKVANEFISRYAQVVTFEAPLELWRGEMKLFGIFRGTEVLSSAPHTVILPAGAGILDAQSLNISQIEKAIEIYHEQNPGRSRYTVIQSAAGFHIVPTHAHDTGGVLREVRSVLDSPVEVPVIQRTASEHLQALLDNVTRITGIPIRWLGAGNFDRRFAANGYLLPQMLVDEDRQYMLFSWGAHAMSARDALIDLSRSSSTTITWALNCGPDGQRGNQPACNFVVNPLIVQGRQIEWDRCTSCKPVPGLQAKSVR